jgi:pyruvate/2-oxoglutarate dehydrogenase complex dihydrolipoamide acyltransferase (E2) component
MSDKQYPAGEQNFRKNVQDADASNSNAQDSEVEATDAAQRLADENNIDLGSLTGSGADGRVTVNDVRAAIEARG